MDEQAIAKEQLARLYRALGVRSFSEFAAYVSAAAQQYNTSTRANKRNSAQSIRQRK